MLIEIYHVTSNDNKGNLKKQPHVKILKEDYLDFPSGPVARTRCSQCRGPGFDPWSKN